MNKQKYRLTAHKDYQPAIVESGLLREEVMARSFELQLDGYFVGVDPMPVIGPISGITGPHSKQRLRRFVSAAKKIDQT